MPGLRTRNGIQERTKESFADGSDSKGKPASALTTTLWICIVLVISMIAGGLIYILGENPELLHTQTQTNRNLESVTYSYPYLHASVYHTLPFSTCPYTSPTYPSIGPDIAYVCQSDKLYRTGCVWHINDYDYDGDANAANFWIEYEKLRQLFKTYMDSISDVNVQLQRLKERKFLHLTYQYISCQTKEEVLTIHENWQRIIGGGSGDGGADPAAVDDQHKQKYTAIFKEFGFNSWEDIEVCFDDVLCMNDNYLGMVAFNLYLDAKSQLLMQRLIDQTEEIEMNAFGIDLTMRRNRDQQSFHLSVAAILDHARNFSVFDAHALMDTVNRAITQKDIQFPCIKLGRPPPLEQNMCYVTNKLKENEPRFKWICEPIQQS